MRKRCRSPRLLTAFESQSQIPVWAKSGVAAITVRLAPDGRGRRAFLFWPGDREARHGGSGSVLRRSQTDGCATALSAPRPSSGWRKAAAFRRTWAVDQRAYDQFLHQGRLGGTLV